MSSRIDAEVPLIFYSALVQFLMSAGHDESEILKDTNLSLSLLRAPDTRVSFPVFSKLVTNAEKVWGRPGLMLSFGASFNLYSLGMVVQAASSSHTLGEGMETLARYFSLRSPLLAYETDHNSQGITFFLSGTRELGKIEKYMVEATFASVTKFLNQLIGERLKTLSFSFKHEIIGPESLYLETLGPNIQFGQNHNFIYLPKSLAKLKLITSNPMSAAEAKQYCDEEIKRLDDSLSLKDVISRLLLARITKATTEPEAAKILGFSARNLRRQLAAEGTTFRDLKNNVKLRTAKKYLTTTHLNIDEIAVAIGYNNTENFSRAFKRWTGITPSHYRRHPHGLLE